MLIFFEHCVLSDESNSVIVLVVQTQFNHVASLSTCYTSDLLIFTLVCADLEHDMLLLHIYTLTRHGNKTCLAVGTLDTSNGNDYGMMDNGERLYTLCS